MSPARFVTVPLGLAEAAPGLAVWAAFRLGLTYTYVTQRGR